MVGRDRELEALTSLFEESIETNRPRLVTVFGPAGIGKSRLVQEFVRLASSLRPEAAVLRGRCLSAGHGITYWALGEILRAACGIALDDSVDEAEQKLRSGLSEILSALDLREDELVQTMFGLATTAGISLQDNPLERMEPRAVADEIGRAWPRFASAYASRAPLVIAVEDLHWAGEQLLDMLKRILARSSGPLVLVATARPEFAQSHPGFVAGREDASSISLRPLTPEQGVRLIEGLLTIADIPGELREDLFAKAEGNPFFLEEIIRRLIDEGALVREGRQVEGHSRRAPDQRARHHPRAACRAGRWTATPREAGPSGGCRRRAGVLGRAGGPIARERKRLRRPPRARAKGAGVRPADLLDSPGRSSSCSSMRSFETSRTRVCRR